ncbi:hypothetical protein [Spongiactinospora sp. TRM90649]|uniref:hypothetical protein n=1 Tax=Spongiactinospora sp. TRM90649 TaxID=3031114 RepID=UPI0023F70AA2|nr:hypothetical protein [Spongiactinospora sp. TRM90649]MDF5756194.1 hypothetical protein [Spongiactinospora sp. TRM90649]
MGAVFGEPLVQIGPSDPGGGSGDVRAGPGAPAGGAVRADGSYGDGVGEQVAAQYGPAHAEPGGQVLDAVPPLGVQVAQAVAHLLEPQVAQALGEAGLGGGRSGPASGGEFPRASRRCPVDGRPSWASVASSPERASPWPRPRLARVRADRSYRPR